MNAPPLRPGRKITGMSAILVPFTTRRDIDWGSLEAHIERTAAAGLVPAVNMDTGYVQLLDVPTQDRVLDRAASSSGGSFVAGAFVGDRPGDRADLDGYCRRIEAIESRGGTPVIFPSHGLNALDPDRWVQAHQTFGAAADRFIAFELGPMFVPYGRIWPLEAYEALLAVESCVGAKHSSLHRQPEWDRIEVRDRLRSDFMVLTGNDLAIDMVMWGSDYLLGISTFAPDLFARRDALWEAGDPGFFELNDTLQYLGQFAFRSPVPGYRHDAAMFLVLRGWTGSDSVPAGATCRPSWDREVLTEIAQRLGVLAGDGPCGPS